MLSHLIGLRELPALPSNIYSPGVPPQLSQIQEQPPATDSKNKAESSAATGQDEPQDMRWRTDFMPDMF